MKAAVAALSLALAPVAAVPAGIDQVLSVAAELAGKGGDEREEIGIGREAAAQLLGGLPLVDSPATQRYVGQVGQWIALQGERPALPWRFALVESPAINAFATPGGIVLVTRGLYELLQSEDELAAVLAHEIAHVQRRHHYTVVRNQRLMQRASDELARRQQKAGGDARTGALVGTVAARAALVVARGLDSGAEHQADRDAMVLAARAGYDSSALLTVLERIEAAPAQGADTSLLTATHPSPAARREALGLAVTPALEALALPSPAAGRLLRHRLPPRR